jgi:aspartate aminotransferase
VGAEEDGFKLDAGRLASALGPKVRMVILNSPSNPTGAAYNEEELKALAKVLSGHDCWIICDDVYEMIRYDGRRPRHLLELEPGLRDRTIVVNSVSKTYAMTGWRIGYTAAPEAVVGAMAMLQGQSTSNPSTIAQAAAAEALAGPQDDLGPMVDEFRRRRDYVCERINTIDGLSVTVPEGAFYVFVNVKDVFEKTATSDGTDFALTLLENASVGLVGGNDFGSSDHVRISYATSMEQLERGLDAIQGWLSSL